MSEPSPHAGVEGDPEASLMSLAQKVFEGVKKAEHLESEAAEQRQRLKEHYESLENMVKGCTEFVAFRVPRQFEKRYACLWKLGMMRNRCLLLEHDLNSTERINLGHSLGIETETFCKLLCVSEDELAELVGPKGDGNKDGMKAERATSIGSPPLGSHEQTSQAGQDNKTVDKSQVLPAGTSDDNSQ
ncbi:uncharacterized protein K452DRAFT_309930 [Aplosporella prunicola CBS 121167]|uniref:Uncharacterized protein n=1 Tax=Aplosporella prunicola CBS 121167 TaxID=1176127 RepID=A0A6A6BCE6_9PEZI|nr:uncharacterized protein K452DRAFT_309930 [Aplosporella prunicola CBS 121167]KAF2140141.1 hypothetical protein K452DRAFT_309930 [Aplosporella prunicola CBS 121167]